MMPDLAGSAGYDNQLIRSTSRFICRDRRYEWVVSGGICTMSLHETLLHEVGELVVDMLVPRYAGSLADVANGTSRVGLDVAEYLLLSCYGHHALL